VPTFSSSSERVIALSVVGPETSRPTVPAASPSRSTSRSFVPDVESRSYVPEVPDVTPDVASRSYVDVEVSEYEDELVPVPPSGRPLPDWLVDQFIP